MIWAVIFCVCLFLLGAILGAYFGWGWGERVALADQAGEAEAAEYVEELRPVEPIEYEGRIVLGRMGVPIWQRALPPPGDRTYGGKVHDIHGGPGEDCWCGYIGRVWPRAELVESDAAWEARVFGDLDRFMGGLLGAYPAPAGDSQ